MKRVNKILLLASFLALLPTGLLGPIYAIFVKNIGGDVMEAGVAYGIFAITSGVFILTLGKSRFFRSHLREMVFLGYLLLAIGNAGYLLVKSPIHLFVVQIIVGLAGGILEPSWDGLFSANLTEERATSFWSLWAGGRDIITGIGAILGGILVAMFSFKLLFIVMAIFNVAATFASIQLLKKPAKETE